MGGVRLAFAVVASLGLVTTAPAQVPCVDPNAGTCVIASSVTVPSGTEWDVGTRALVIAGKIVTVQAAGLFSIRAGAIMLDTGAKIVANGKEGYGGTVSLESTGDVALKPDTRIDVSADQAGGVIAIGTTGGTLVLQGELRASATHRNGSGGFVSVLGDTWVAVGGAGVDVSGGSMADGGFVEVYATGGVTLGAPIEASGGEYGGGAVEIDAEGNVVTASAGTIDVRGRNGAGSGGAVYLGSSAGVSVGAQIIGTGAAGGLDGDGFGAEVSLFAETGDVEITAPLDLRGGGDDGFGGLLAVSAGGAITVAQPVVASAKAGGFGRGGEVELEAGSSITISSTVDVRGGSVGGTVAGRAGDAVSLPGAILAAGTSIFPPSTSPLGGVVDITGCAIDLPAGGVVSNAGAADPLRGRNLLRSGGGMTIGGTMTAGLANVLEWRTVVPTLLASRMVTPAEEVVENDTLPCCGQCTTSTTSSTSTSSTTTIAPTTTSTTTTTVPTTTVPETTTSTSSTSSTTSTTSTTSTSSTSSTTSTTTSSSSSSTSSTFAPTTTTLPTTSTTAAVPASTTTSTTVPAVCIDLPLTGFDAVDCRLDIIDRTIADAPVEMLGGRRWAQRLDRALARARKAVATARSGRRVTPSLRRANQQLRTFQRDLARAQVKGMSQLLGARLLALASGASSEIGTLRQR